MVQASNEQQEFIIELLDENSVYDIFCFMESKNKENFEELTKEEADDLIQHILQNEQEIHKKSDYFLDVIDDDYIGKVERIQSKLFHLPIPLRTIDFRFCLVRKRQKKAFEKGWQESANYSWNSPILQTHLGNNGNYGVIGGYGGLVIIDIDNENYIDSIKNTLPPTFTVKTKKGVHLYFAISDGEIPSKVLKDIETGENVGDVKGGGKKRPKSRGYVVGPGSIHPSGQKYELIANRNVHKIKAEELLNKLNAIGISFGTKHVAKKGTALRPTQGNNKTQITTEGVEFNDPPYLQYLPLWYRTHHRKQNGEILRKQDGMIVHLRICATLKKFCGDQWKDYAHDLTNWMFQDEYDFEKTEYQLDRIKEKFFFRSKDYFFYGDLQPDLDYLTGEERRDMIKRFSAT